MSGTTDEAGHRQPLLKRLKTALAAATLMGALICGPMASWTGDAKAGGDTRTLRLYAINTKERLDITYKVDGRYVPSALAKINHLLRDWRRNKTIRIDPKTIDLMWELHADLGSKQPIHIICGYRSAGTNAFLKRIGRGVARKSQHVKGKAIDLYFPDVSTERIRNSALVRMVGGVGYYRRGGGPKGFVHIDSGNVRHWPRIAPSQLARIFKDYRSTVGRRVNRNDQVMIASADAEKMKAMAAGAGDEEDLDEDIAETPKIAKAAPPAPPPKPVILAAKAQADVPVPRQKPNDILFVAAANMKIIPAAAPPERQNFAAKRRTAEPIGTVEAADTMLVEAPPELVVNSDGKSGFEEPAPTQLVAKKPPAKTVSASTGDSELNWWPSSLAGEADQAEQPGLPSGLFPSAHAAEPPALEPASNGKADMQEINRAAKGDALIELPRRRQKLGQLTGQ